LSTVGNGDLLASVAIPILKTLYGLYHIYAPYYLTKDHMLAILRTICIWCSTCHAQDAKTCVLQDEVLIIKFLPKDRLAASVIIGT
jgi:hypothetical protein